MKHFWYSDSNQTIGKFIIRPTLRKIIVKFAALDGFSFNRITKSELISQSMTSRFNLPRNPSDAKQLMMDYYKEKKEELISKIN